MANVDLLRRTLAHIEANPEIWNQEDYRCGSGLCFAGWAAQLAGGRWYTADPNHRLAQFLVSEPADGNSELRGREFFGVRVSTVHPRAQRLLDLDDEDAEALFHPDNTIEDLRGFVAALTTGSGGLER